ncbi:phosphorylase [Leptospira congkakensis]|uniref:Phosphorylase n=1 Tax=Leptospira congkakensis TaxID=2484932 RepID=A0A4Z1A7T9_9LEPT|nr:phosphorylase [Leptospira congkakensis]TGL90741.1 phosphorylase [Leptospira congkakensis]TGL91748.1 phosphorylase [Leptospira congkakensis]TGL98802.1 phosphorylase [Leptospira congkakensis]
MLPFNPHQTLITGAFEGEIGILRTSGKFPHLDVMGIGNLEAGINLYKYLSQNKEIQNIIFFGSCGAYEWREISIGSIVSPNFVYTKELSHALKLSKQIPESPEFYELFPDKSIPMVKCNAPTTISLTEFKKPPESSWENLEVENLELFGIAKVAANFSVTVTAYLAVTNLVGKEGSADWAKNWKDLSHSLQNRFLKELNPNF